MSRTWVPGLALVLLPAPAIHGQPPNRPPTALKSFGGEPEGFYRSAVGRWADQLAADLAAARAGLPAAAVTPRVRQAAAARSERVEDAARDLTRVARRNGDRGQIARRFEEVEAAVGELTEVVSRNPGLGPLFTRPTYSYQQLAAAVGEGEADPGRVKRIVVRLATGFAGEADDLWDAADRHLPGGLDRDLDRALKRSARLAQRLADTLDETGDLPAAGRAFSGVAAAWNDVLGRLGRLPNLPAPVRAEATRADGLFRRLGDRLGVAPPNPGPGPGPNPPPIFPPRAGGTLAVAAGTGGGPRVQVYHDLSGRAAFDFFAYDDGFRGGVRVSVADVNGDGTDDIVTGPGPGMGPLVRVFDGRDMGLLAEFVGHDPAWTGGVTVAAAGRGADGRSLVAVAPDPGGGPVVKVFDLAQGKEVASFLAFPANFRGGARVAWVDLRGNGTPEVVAAPGPGDIGPLVRVFNPGNPRRPVAEFRPFDPDWRGGVWLGGHGNLVVAGADAGGVPGARAYDVLRPGKPVAEWVPYPPDFRGGVRVATADLNGDGVRDFLFAPGPGARGSAVRVFNGADQRDLGGWEPFPGFDGGAFVAGK